MNHNYNVLKKVKLQLLQSNLNITVASGLNAKHKIICTTVLFCWLNTGPVWHFKIRLI